MLRVFPDARQAQQAHGDPQQPERGAGGQQRQQLFDVPMSATPAPGRPRRLVT